MSHPIHPIPDKDVKAVERIRAICLALPESNEKLAWGHPTFRAGKKMFAGIGRDEDKLALGMRFGFERQVELLKDKRFYPTPYAAHQGWVSLHITGKVNWKELESLIRESYCTVALKRMLKALEAE